MKKGFRYALFATAVLLFASCSATKYVPEGSYCWTRCAYRRTTGKSSLQALSMYVRQNPNAKWFSLIKTQLYVYNWSGRDSARWINRTLRRIGDAPVIYKEEETKRSGEEMKKAVQNMGYFYCQDTISSLPIRFFVQNPYTSSSDSTVISVSPGNVIPPSTVRLAPVI